MHWKHVAVLIGLTALVNCDVDNSTSDLAMTDAQILAEFWDHMADMAHISDVTYQLASPNSVEGILQWGSYNEVELTRMKYLLMSYESQNGLYAVFFNEEKRHLVVSFRGTRVDKPGDMIANLDRNYLLFDPDDPLKGSVTKGYMTRWLDIRDSVFSDMIEVSKSFEGKFARIDFVGHSLGGAVATIGGVDAFQQGLSLSIFAFSVPNFSDLQFAKYVKDSIDKGLVYVTHEILGDPITSLPILTEHPFNLLNQGENSQTRFIHLPVMPDKSRHAIQHVRQAILHTDPRTRESLQHFYRALPSRQLGLCKRL